MCFLYNYYLCCNSTYRLRYWNEKMVATSSRFRMLQQYLPFTVLKPRGWIAASMHSFFIVATVLTVYGIETLWIQFWIFEHIVATVLTVYGIETGAEWQTHLSPLPLQQYLPFTVLKRSNRNGSSNSTYRLRYWNNIKPHLNCYLVLWIGCNSTYRLRYWNTNV